VAPQQKSCPAQHDDRAEQHEAPVERAQNRRQGERDQARRRDCGQCPERQAEAMLARLDGPRVFLVRGRGLAPFRVLR
jgi:hypothetical protein